MISTVSPNEYLLNYGGKHHILVTPNGCKKEPFTYSAFEAKAAFDVMSILCNSHVQGNQLWMIHAAYSAAVEPEYKDEKGIGGHLDVVSLIEWQEFLEWPRTQLLKCY